MRQIVSFAALFGLTNQILRRRDVRGLHPLHFRRAEISYQLLGSPPSPTQLVVAQVHDDRAEPPAKRHLGTIRRQGSVRADETLLRDVPRHLFVRKKSPA